MIFRVLLIVFMREMLVLKEIYCYRSFRNLLSLNIVLGILSILVVNMIRFSILVVSLEYGVLVIKYGI